MPDEIEMVTLTMTRKQFEALKVMATVGMEILIGDKNAADEALKAGALMRLGVVRGAPVVIGKMKAVEEAHKLLEKAVQELGKPVPKEEWAK